MAKPSDSESSSSEGTPSSGSTASEDERMNEAEANQEEELDEEELEAVARTDSPDDDDAKDDEDTKNDEAKSDNDEDADEDDPSSHTEIGKRERARLREMHKIKRQKIQEILDEQNAAIDADMNNKGKGRLKYLLQQTEIFSHFAKGAQSESERKPRGRGRHASKITEEEEDEEYLKEEEDALSGAGGTRLVSQPSCKAQSNLSVTSMDNEEKRINEKRKRGLPQGERSRLIKKLDPITRKVTTIAGTGTAGFKDGPSLMAQLSEPSGIVETSQGRLLIADTNNNVIRYIDLNKKVPTLYTLELKGVQPPSSKPKSPKRLRRRASADTDIVRIDGGKSKEGIFNLTVFVPEGYHFSKEARSKFEVETDPPDSINIEPINGYLSPDGSASLKFMRNSSSPAMGRINCKVYYCKEDEVCLYQSVAFDVSFKEEPESNQAVVNLSYTVKPKVVSELERQFLSLHEGKMKKKAMRAKRREISAADKTKSL